MLECSSDAPFDDIELIEHLSDVVSLLFERTSAFAKLGQDELDLTAFAIRCIVECEHVADFGDGKTDTAATQYQLEPDPLPLAVNPGLPIALRPNETLGLVMADRAQRGIEFACKIADAIAGFDGLRARRLPVSVNRFGHGVRIPCQ